MVHENQDFSIIYGTKNMMKQRALKHTIDVPQLVARNF